jgi:NADPH:quinone reductase-like Zn-dependent oxidoreductase
MGESFEGRKVVVVGGGGSDMGPATAHQVVAGDGTVVITGRDQDRVQPAVETLSQNGKAWGITAGLTKTRCPRSESSSPPSTPTRPARQRRGFPHPEGVQRVRRGLLVSPAEGNLGNYPCPGIVCRTGFPSLQHFHQRQMTEEIILMKAIVVTDQAAGTAGMTLAERPEPDAAVNDVVVQVYASGFTPGELTWRGTWTDRPGRDRTPSIPGHEVAGVVSALGYGMTGLSVGQRVFGLTDWTRDGTLAQYVAVEARNLAPLPGDVDFTLGASLPISGLTAWQGLFVHGRLRVGQSVLVHGAAGGVGSMVTQLAREAGAYVIGTGHAADRQTALDFGVQEFVDLDNEALEDAGEVDLVFDVLGGDIGKRSAGMIRAGGTLVTIAGPPDARPADGLAVDFVVVSDRAQLGDIVQRVRDGRLRTNIGHVATLDDAVAAFNPTKRIKGKTIIRVRP